MTAIIAPFLLYLNPVHRFVHMHDRKIRRQRRKPNSGWRHESCVMLVGLAANQLPLKQTEWRMDSQGKEGGGAGGWGRLRSKEKYIILSRYYNQ